MTAVDISRLFMMWRPGECPCGSGEERHEVMDSRGIYLTMGCKTCLPDKLSGYRKDVLYGPSYEADEPIEEEPS